MGRKISELESNLPRPPEHVIEEVRRLLSKGVKDEEKEGHDWEQKSGVNAN